MMDIGGDLQRLVGRGAGGHVTLLHHDRDFATVAGVTGQALRWYGPD